MWLFLAFLAVPLIEIALFIQIGGVLGLWPTLFIVIITAVLGTFLVRTQGLATLQRLQRSISQLSDPSEPLAHGAMILFAGALLLTPGFFTDAVGLSLMIPGVRQAVWTAVRSRIKVHGHGQQQRPTTAANATIDGEYVELSTNDKDSPWTRD